MVMLSGQIFKNRRYMKILIPILILSMLSGCAALKGNKGTDPQVSIKPEASYSDPYGFIDPTFEGLSVWLESFIDSSKSIREVSKNFYLHNSIVYQKEFVEHNNKFFDQMLLDRGEFRLALDRQDVELRDKLIKALLLVVQIRIDTYLPVAEGEASQNLLARKNLEMLNELAKDRVDLDVRDLGLSCRNLQGCLEEFEKIISERG